MEKYVIEKAKPMFQKTQDKINYEKEEVNQLSTVS
jgi:hypothetical protein